MAIKHTKRKVAPKKDAAATSDIVVVGNYKARQLDWIKKNGVYNYPVRAGDAFTPRLWPRSASCGFMPMRSLSGTSLLLNSSGK